MIDSKKMLALPLNGRSYLDLLGLQAGVAPTSAGTIGGDRPVSGYLSNAGNISVNGQRETANAFLVNGGDVSEGRNLGLGWFRISIPSKNFALSPTALTRNMENSAAR